MQRLTAGAIGTAVATLVLGVVVGALGTVMHRSIPPWGLVVCLALALAAAITARAWGGLLALAGYAIGLFVSVQVLAQKGPGGDTLVPDGRRSAGGGCSGRSPSPSSSASLPRALFDDRPRARPAAAAGAPVLEGDGAATP